MLFSRRQQSGRAIHIGTISSVLRQSGMTSSRRIDPRRFVVQHRGNVVRVIQPNDVLTGHHGFSYDGTILFVLVFARFMQGIEAVFPCKND